MGRTLPWLHSVGQTKSRKAATSTAPSIKAKEPRTKARRADRTPSTSPPPAPPPHERMREGDEAWIMVEDELLDTAKSYTRDLHVAEYHRLRSLAQRKRNEELGGIRRPVDNRTPMSAERKTTKLSEDKKRLQVLNGHGSKGSKEGDGEDGESDDSDMLIGDRNLAGLMHRSRDERGEKPALEPIARLTPPKPRASASSVSTNVGMQNPPRTSGVLPSAGMRKVSDVDELNHIRVPQKTAAISSSSSKASVAATSHVAKDMARSPRANFDEPKVRRPIGPLKSKQEPTSQPKRRFSNSSSESEKERAPLRQNKRPLKKADTETDPSRRRIELDEIPLFLTE